MHSRAAGKTPALLLASLAAVVCRLVQPHIYFYVVEDTVRENCIPQPPPPQKHTQKYAWCCHVSWYCHASSCCWFCPAAAQLGLLYQTRLNGCCNGAGQGAPVPQLCNCQDCCPHLPTCCYTHVLCCDTADALHTLWWHPSKSCQLPGRLARRLHAHHSVRGPESVGLALKELVKS
jgi:hypothetical protein